MAVVQQPGPYVSETQTSTVLKLFPLLNIFCIAKRLVRLKGAQFKW